MKSIGLPELERVINDFKYLLASGGSVILYTESQWANAPSSRTEYGQNKSYSIVAVKWQFIIDDGRHCYNSMEYFFSISPPYSFFAMATLPRISCALVQ